MGLHLWTNRIRSRFSRSEGQTMAEYAVILGVITPAIVLAFFLLGEQIVVVIDRVRGFLS
jgi:Flp pilus assembly pilin Flp